MCDAVEFLFCKQPLFINLDMRPANSPHLEQVNGSIWKVVQVHCTVTVASGIITANILEIALTIDVVSFGDAGKCENLHSLFFKKQAENCVNMPMSCT